MYELRLVDDPEKTRRKTIEILREGKVVAVISPNSSGLTIISELIPDDPIEAMESSAISFVCDNSSPKLLINLDNLLLK